MQRAKLQQNRRNNRRLNKTEKSESFLEPEEGLQEAFLFIILNLIILNRVSFLLPLRRSISSEKIVWKKMSHLDMLWQESQDAAMGR